MSNLYNFVLKVSNLLDLPTQSRNQSLRFNRKITKLLIKIAKFKLVEFDANVATFDAKLETRRLYGIGTEFINTKLVTRTAIIKLGWSPALIKRYLDPADIYRPNRTFGYLPNVPVYSAFRVNITSRQPEVAAALADLDRKAGRSTN